MDTPKKKAIEIIPAQITLIILLLANILIISTTIPRLHVRAVDVVWGCATAFGVALFCRLHLLAATGILFFPEFEKGKFAKEWKPKQNPFSKGGFVFYQPQTSIFLPQFGIYRSKQPEFVYDFYAIIRKEHGVSYSDSLTNEAFLELWRYYENNRLDREIYFYKMQAKPNGNYIYLLYKLFRHEKTGKARIQRLPVASRHAGKNSLFLLVLGDRPSKEGRFLYGWVFVPHILTQDREGVQYIRMLKGIFYQSIIN